MTAHINITAEKAAAAPDYAFIKTRQNAAWGAGDYSKIGTTLQITGERLAEALDLRPGSKVLDVAAGNGNATLAFARRWHDVTSTDYVDTLLAQGRARAIAEGLDVRYQVADAEDLPFADGEFDAVVSTFGVMFAPNQQQSTRELARACRSGGKIGLANWTPDGFTGQLFRTLGSHVPAPKGVRPPTLWGTRDWLNDAFGPVASRIDITPKAFDFRYRSAAHFVDVFRTWCGPTQKTFLALDTDGQAALEADILALIADFNTATDGSMAVPGAYLEVAVHRK